MSKRPVKEIRVGKRHREDLGDIDALAASIAHVGLLHPIVIRPDGRLIAGERRLAACKRLGWTHIPATVVALDDIVRGEFAENAVRKDFTLSEAVAIKTTLESIEAKEAKQRQGTRTDKHPGKFPKSSKGRAADKAAKVTGLSRTLEKAKAVVDAAEAEPERFGKLKEDMDRTGRANGPFKRLKVIRQAEEIRKEPPPLPERGPYRVAVADVPWPHEPDDKDPSHRGLRPYLTMSIEQMCALDVGSIMHADSILWFWVSNFHLRYAYQVLAAWGFHATPTMLTWAKDKSNWGHWLYGQTEHAIMAVRGKPVVTLSNQATLLSAPARAHSQKPQEFYDLVESLCPAPRYVDLFSRYQHKVGLPRR
jgi:N6-adenosine-specific RNA methylase IME4